jgi:hypothetical protein
VPSETVASTPSTAACIYESKGWPARRRELHTAGLMMGRDTGAQESLRKFSRVARIKQSLFQMPKGETRPYLIPTLPLYTHLQEGAWGWRIDKRRRSRCQWRAGSTQRWLHPRTTCACT